MTRRTTDDVIRTITRNGWAPAPYAHRALHIRDAIRAACIRPAVKQCYANAQRLVLGQQAVPLRYVEGVVMSIIPIEHAWVMDAAGVEHDVTLEVLPEVLWRAPPMDREQLFAEVGRRGWYGPGEHLGMYRTATILGVATTGSVEEVQARVVAALAPASP